MYTPYQSTNFQLTVTDDYGCKLQDDIDVLLLQDFDLSLSTEKLNCCAYNLVPSVTFKQCENVAEDGPEWLLKKYQNLNYQWSDGYNGAERVVAPSQNTTYTLTVSNNCFSKTVSIDVDKTPSGNFTTMIAGNSFKPSSIYPSNNKLIIKEFGTNAPADGEPAYNATGYMLRLFDSFGGLFREIKVDKKCPLLQGEIIWDGRDNKGDLVPLGVYNYTLYLKNECKNIDFTPICDFFGKNSTDVCSKRCWRWWPPGRYCCEYIACPYSVTVIR